MKIWTPLYVSLTGLGATVIGGVLNLLVIAVNAGRMPVFFDLCGGHEGLLIDGRHACGSGGTQLVGLTDWIQVGGNIYSPGDFFLLAGEVLVLFAFFLLGGLIILQRISNRK